jgi:hypothetical protein
MQTKISGVASGCGCFMMLLLAMPAWAHHSFAAEYDSTKPIKLQGTVKKVEFINPHSWITIDVKKSDGTMETWEIEAGAPNAIFRRGLSKDAIPVGMEIVVNGFEAKAGNHRANGLDLTLPDGKRLSLASSSEDKNSK